MEYNTEYDPTLNILYMEFSGVIDKPEDIHYIFNRNLEEFRKINKKIWLIVNSSKLKMKNTKLVSEFKKLDEEKAKRYILGECAWGATGIQKVMTHLFNTISGKKSPIFGTREQALNWVLKQQEKVGIEAPFE